MGLVVKDLPAGLELSCIGQDKVTGGEVGHIFVHIKAARKGYGKGEQHHCQRQGQHGNKSLAPAAAQITTSKRLLTLSRRSMSSS